MAKVKAAARGKSRTRGKETRQTDTTPQAADDVRLLARDAALAALTRLAELAKSEDERVALAASQELLDDSRRTRLRGEMKWKVPAEPRLRAHIRARLQQHGRHLGIAMHGGPVQCRHSIALRGIYISPSFQQRTHPLNIACLCRRRDRRLGWRCTNGRDQPTADADDRGDEAATNHDQHPRLLTPSSETRQHSGPWLSCCRQTDRSPGRSSAAPTASRWPSAYRPPP